MSDLDRQAVENERLRGALAEIEGRWLSARERANRAEAEIECLKQEVQRLLVDNAELSDECDQWGEKLFAVWAEVNSLRAQLAQHGG